MKLTVTKESFLRALERCATATEATTIACTQCVLLGANSDDTLQLTSTNLVLTVDTAIVAKIQTQGSLAVNCAKLIALVRALPNEAGVTLLGEDGGGRLTVTSGTRKYVLASLPASDFPAIAEPKKTDARIQITSSQLQRLIARTEYAADSGRVLLNVVRLLATSDQITAMALGTAMFAVAAEKPEAPLSADESADITVPRPFLKPLIAMLAGVAGSERVELISSKTHLYAETEDTLVAVLQAAEQFTQWDKMLEASRTGAREICAIHCVDLVAALRAVTAVRTDDPVSLVIAPDDETLTLSVASAEYNADDKIQVKGASEALACKANPVYLTDTLKAVNSNFKLSVNDTALIFDNGEGFMAALSQVLT